MARPAGELTRIKLQATSNRVRATRSTELESGFTAGTAKAKARHGLAWIATQSGADSLAAQITGLTSQTEEWPTDGTTIVVQLEGAQGNTFAIDVQVKGADGLDVNDTREYKSNSANLQAALAQIATDCGFTSLAAAITGWATNAFYEAQLQVKPVSEGDFVVFVKVVALPHTTNLSHYPAGGIRDQQQEFVNAYHITVGK
jgi:hypothetical protein